VIAWIAGSLTSVAGLAISYEGDFSTGATLVCAFGAALVLAGVTHWFHASDTRRARLSAAHTAGHMVAGALLAASGAWIMISPRADQPILDAAESAFPSIRSAYMDEKSRATAEEARQYAARYRYEAEALRKREAERRWSGEPLPEEEVRRIASFLKSYNEMVTGEEFVIRELRDRARAEHRFAIGLALLALAAILFASRAGRLRAMLRIPG
jgi:hypothetical protein